VSDRWEYLFLTTVDKAKRSPKGWLWTSTAVANRRGREVARWTKTDAAGKGAVTWRPEEGTEPEYAAHGIGHPLDLLGALGWELVNVLVSSSAVTTSDEPGWTTQVSAPLHWQWILKRRSS
jgi:hypothetical protein